MGWERAVWQVECLLALGHWDTEEPGVITGGKGVVHAPQLLPALPAQPPGHQAGVLQEARVPIISNDVCNGPDFYGNQIKPKMFCAGYLEGGIDACQVRDCGGSPWPCHSRHGDAGQWVVRLPISGPEGFVATAQGHLKGSPAMPPLPPLGRQWWSLCV